MPRFKRGLPLATRLWRSPDRPSLSNLMTGQRLSDYLGAGLAVTFTSAPSLSSTYALDPLTLSQTGNVAKDSASGLGLPGGLVSFTYPDINGNPDGIQPSADPGPLYGAAGLRVSRHVVRRGTGVPRSRRGHAACHRYAAIARGHVRTRTDPGSFVPARDGKAG